MPKPKTEAAEYERLTVRLPPKIMQTLRKQAKTDRRPLNTHVVWCLEKLLHYEKEKQRDYVGSRES